MTALAAFDARAARRDPTGTAKLRARFRAAAKLRLRQLRAQLRTAVTDQDTLGLNQGTPMGFHPADVRLNAFHAWLAYMAGHFLAGNWSDRFIDQAWESGRQVAAAEFPGGSVPQQYPGTPQHLTQLAQQELEGIIAVIVQQVSRTASEVLQRRLKTAPAWRGLAEAFDNVAPNRLMAMANVSVISAFNQAKLESYRDIGIDRVGIIAETLGAMNKVGVQTAGDDRVCPRCDKIAAEAPYTLDKVPTIPAHPNCRCSVFAWN